MDSSTSNRNNRIAMTKAWSQPQSQQKPQSALPSRYSRHHNILKMNWSNRNKQASQGLTTSSRPEKTSSITDTFIQSTIIGNTFPNSVAIWTRSNTSTSTKRATVAPRTSLGSGGSCWLCIRDKICSTPCVKYSATKSTWCCTQWTTAMLGNVNERSWPLYNVWRTRICIKIALFWMNSLSIERARRLQQPYRTTCWIRFC